MSSVMTTQFVGSSNHADSAPFSLIEQKSLPLRLAEELVTAVHDIARNPRLFLRELFASDNKDEKRRQRIYAGLDSPLLLIPGCLILIGVVGWEPLLSNPLTRLQVRESPGFRSVNQINQPPSRACHGAKRITAGAAAEDASPHLP